MITTPEIICDLFSFLDKDQIERIQLVNQLWNNVIIRHNNILPLRQFLTLDFIYNEDYLIEIYGTEEDWSENLGSYIIKICATEEDLFESLGSYIIKFDGTDLSKVNVSSRYSQLTVDEVLTNLNDVVFDHIHNRCCVSEDRLDNFLNLMRLVTTKTGGRFRGNFGIFFDGRLGPKLDEIFNNYIIVDELILGHYYNPNTYIREVCANPEMIQLPSIPKEIILGRLEFKENDEVLHFICNGKLNGANRLTIEFETFDLNFSDTNYGNFIRQWFELYRTHQNPTTLVGKFKLGLHNYLNDIGLDTVKTFLNNTQLRVKYSLERFHIISYGVTNQYLKRRCVLHETDSYALVIEMVYEEVTDMSSINASDLDQPPCKKMETISLCVKSL